MANHTRSKDSPSPSQVLEEIAWYRARMRDAAQGGREAAREARAAYAPFVLRRLKLLAALRERAADDGCGGRPAPPIRSSARPRARGRWPSPRS